MKIFCNILIISLLQNFCFAQSSVQVVTKTIEKDFVFVAGNSLKINAQKADIKIVGWNKAMISVKMKLIAKNPDKKIAEEEKRVGGQLGRPSGARFRTYERLKNFADQNQGTLFVTPELLKAIDDIYRFPLREYAKDVLNRQMRAGNARRFRGRSGIRPRGERERVSDFQRAFTSV